MVDCVELLLGGCEQVELALQVLPMTSLML